MLNEKNKDCILFWRLVVGLQMSVMMRVTWWCADGEKVRRPDGWEPVVESLSVSFDFLFFQGGISVGKTDPTAPHVHSLQSLTVIRAETSKPYSVTHIIDRISCNKRVPPVSNPCFLVSDSFCYFYYYCRWKEKQTFKVELKIRLDFSSGNRKPQSWTQTCKMSSQVTNKLPVNIDLIKMICKRWSVMCDGLTEAAQGEFFCQRWFIYFGRQENFPQGTDVRYQTWALRWSSFAIG